MGFSRDSFDRFKELYEQGGEAALQEISRKKPILTNRVDPQVEMAVVQHAIDQPAYGQHRVSNELRKKGILVSFGGVRSIWLRHDLGTFAKRLKAFSAKVARNGLILTEDQLYALKKRARKNRHMAKLRRSTLATWAAKIPTTLGTLRRRPYLPANLYRYLLQSGFGQAL